MKPVIAIVGRPNVGKSTLFNRIVGKKLAVVEEVPGLTRDRLYSDAQWEEKLFLVVDTGGFHPVSDEDITQKIMKQAIIAVQEADVVILLMDAETGLVPSDRNLCDKLRKYNKKIFYVVNKIDSSSKEKALIDFYPLGETILPVSALNGYRFDELMDRIAETLPLYEEDKVQYPRIAIIGRPNVGKSTLANSLLGKERMIVDTVAGTTRDAVNSLCSYQKRKYILVDTAGIRKKGRMAKTFERYSFIRTVKNIENCDVTLILLDAEEGVIELDQKIASLVHDAGKGGIVLFNKWDLTDKTSRLLKKLILELRHKLWFMHYAPVLTISALSRQRIVKLFPLVDEVIAESKKTIRTPELNVFLSKCLSKQPPRLYRGKQVKLFYIAQVGIRPPSFVIFANKRQGVKPEYLRFLESQLRERYSFKGIPVRFYVKQRKK
jgi:GTP-binding protein